AVTGGDRYAAELSTARRFGGRQLEFHEEGPAGRAGDRRHFHDRAFDRRQHGADANGKSYAEREIADERLGHVGLKAVRFRVFHLDNRFTRWGEVADIDGV